MSNKREVEIRLLTLSDCDYCIWLKNELDREGISYDNIDADIYSDFSKAIENKFQTNAYPIVLIDIHPGLIVIVPETELETSNTLLTFDTIPELVGIIKKYI